MCLVCTQTAVALTASFFVCPSFVRTEDSWQGAPATPACSALGSCPARRRAPGLAQTATVSPELVQEPGEGFAGGRLAGLPGRESGRG